MLEKIPFYRSRVLQEKYCTSFICIKYDCIISRKQVLGHSQDMQIRVTQTHNETHYFKMSL